MRTVLVGAVEGSRIALDALIAAKLPPALVVTLPLEAAARHSDFADLTTPARSCGSAVFHATNVNAPQTLEAVAAVGPDLVLVLGWSQICKEPFRTMARLGTVGFHPAPLPRLRGRAVIPWTILRGETTSGSTLFWLDEGIDSGPILAQRLFSLAGEETARSLYEKHTQNLAAMVPEAVVAVREGTAARVEQDQALASYCAKRTPEDGLIDWAEPAEAILRLMRAVGDPYPGAFSDMNGTRFVIDSAVPFPHSDRYVGLTGQVQAHTDAGFVVRCGDRRCIEVTAWRGGDGRRPKLHGKFARRAS